MEFAILNWFAALHTPWLNVVMKLFTHMGDTGILWILLTLLLLIFGKDRKLGECMALALILDLLLCNCLLKPLVARVRPYDVNTAVTLLIKAPTDYSFPSGHTAASFAAVSAMMGYGCRKRLWIPSLITAVLIALSRMYFYVHYPTDVLGGLALGLFCGWAARRMMRWAFAKWDPAKQERKLEA